MAYDVVINKKFTHVKLFSIKKSVKGEQNKVSKLFTSLVYKYVLRQKPEGEGKI
jgi:hypothetical protein